MTIYATFRKNSPHFPGYAELLHPSDDKDTAVEWAMGVLCEEYGDTWGHIWFTRSALYDLELENKVNTFTYTNEDVV